MCKFKEKCQCLSDVAAKGKEKAEQLAVDYKEGKVTGRELVLSGIVLFLAGIVIGMLFSPRKVTMMGCNNGNNTGIGYDEEEEE